MIEQSVLLTARHDAPQSRVSMLRLIVTAVVLFVVLLTSAIYVEFSPLVMRRTYYKALFQPYAYPGGDYDFTTVDGIRAEDQFLTAGSEKIHGWYFHLPGASKIILMHHGNGGNISIVQWYVDIALRSGASVFVYDYEGYGRSSGTPSIISLERDADAAYAFLITKKGWRPDQIVNMGFSLGTGVAAELSERSPCNSVILLAPYTSIRRVARDNLKFLCAYPDFLWPERDLGVMRLAGKAEHPPMMVFHGKHDKLISIKNSLELIKASPSVIKFLPLECDHALSPEQSAMLVENFKSFLRR